MFEEEMKARTKAFALRIIKLVEALPKTRTADVIVRQLLRSATSVGANYRSACRGRSKADFISKLGISLEEMDESVFWLELLPDSGTITSSKLDDLFSEANQLTAIFVTSLRTAKANQKS